jgi:HTH-type transcriptional regulator / antitoxin HipB
MNNALTDIDELFTKEYGPKGSPGRVQFEHEAQSFLIAERLKEERRLVNLTQEELAQKPELARA